MSESPALPNLMAFPGFSFCPRDDDINLDYYASENGYYFRPSRHWCLLAEVTHKMTLMRLRLQARDRDGREFPVAFHLEDGGQAPSEQFQIGHTIAILYAHKQFFGFHHWYSTGGQIIYSSQSSKVLGRNNADGIGHPTSIIGCLEDR